MRPDPHSCLALAAVALALIGCQSPVSTFTGDSSTDPDAGPDGGNDTLPGGCTSSAECDDLQPCNGTETCLDGTCVPGAQPGEGAACTARSGADGTCRLSLCVPLTCGDGAVQEHEQCDDANLVVGDGCELDCSTSCESDAACADDSVCTADACVEGGTGRLCVSMAVDGPCDDRDVCTSGDHCLDGVCIPGDPVCVCETDGDCSSHDDEDLCNGSMVCAGGMCVVDPASVVSCDPPLDGGCVLVACDPLTGLCGVTGLDGVPCDDGDPCTTGDACVDGSCVPGSPFSCDDGNPCTLEICLAPGGCVIEPLDGLPCDDHDACTEGETCSASGECVPFSPTSCDDGNDCTSDLCDVVTGCYHMDSEAGCDDSDPCTTGDTCYMGTCVGDALPVAYGDLDGDGFGIAGDTVCTDVLPDAHSWASGDCCDAVVEVFPGQGAWFTEPFVCDDIGMPAWDYDCSGAIEQRFVDMAGCTASGAGTCIVSGGWLAEPGLGGPPPCGVSGRWLTVCTYTTMGCWPSSWDDVTQACH